MPPKPQIALRSPGVASSLERLSELAAREHAHRAAAEMDDEMTVAVPKAALELVGPDHKPAFARADVKEQRLDLRVVAAKQDVLQSLVELPAVEPT
jgi:hypothetical protein